MAAEIQHLYNGYKEEVGKLQQMEKDRRGVAEQGRELAQKLHENNMVLKELEQVKEGEVVYKVVGPVMINQPLEEATMTVKNRIEHINGGLAALEDKAKQADEAMKAQNKKVIELSNTLQAMQHAMSRK